MELQNLGTVELWNFGTLKLAEPALEPEPGAESDLNPTHIGFDGVVEHLNLRSGAGVAEEHTGTELHRGCFIELVGRVHAKVEPTGESVRSVITGVAGGTLAKRGAAASPRAAYGVSRRMKCLLGS